MEGLLCGLATYLSGSSDVTLNKKLAKLIRLRPKELSDVDVVLPTIDVWKKCIGEEPLTKFEELLRTFSDKDTLISVNNALPIPWKFSTILLLNGKMLLKLNRLFVMKEILPTILIRGHRFESHSEQKSVKVVNCEMASQNTSQTVSVFSQLSEVRCNQVCQLLKRVYIFCSHDVINDDKTTPDFTLNVGCADPQYLRSYSSKLSPDPCTKADSILKVGPVVEAQTKKKDFSCKLNDVYSQMFKYYYEISMERREETVSKSSILQDIGKSVCAELQFQLLSCNIGQPICLLTECQNSDSSFVLYNYARISQIIATFEKSKEYPALPDEIDFSLLQENEEWEIFFSCILPFTEIVFSTIEEDGKEVFRLNKICALLIALSKMFSRYYNRVRILREPLPHFLPTIFCRITFLKCIQITFEQGFALLDVSPIRKM